MGERPTGLDETEVVPFQFWGVTVDVHLRHSEDRDHVRYYFQDYLRPPGGAPSDLSIALLSTEGCFIGGAAHVRKDIHIRTAGNSWQLYESYVGEPTRATPLPPFLLPPLKSIVRPVHASAVASPQDPSRAVLLHGPSKAGKSSVLLELTRLGWHFVCDDTALLHNERTVYSYTRPIGVRESTLKTHPWLRAHLAHAPSFTTPTGTTWAVHANLLPAKRSPAATDWAWTVALRPSPTYHVDRLTETRWEIALDSRQDIGRAVADIITELTGAPS
ncbi:hypothetical protein [Streptomyces formicae]|uniref:Uncharacterized protein n=1 Tax=Streptomyces formicae TaxID=1616117 RepID=A0A291QHY5_9ACTN|nr:hypothetical protein [Streptomyces formicae]ATL31168.1 hypothetical protein KY5_6150 [Streptomyces formicae]